MKPLPPAPFTKEDAYVWSVVLTRFQPKPLFNRAIALQADRRDAALMSWLSRSTVRHYEGLALPPEARLPLAHLWVRIDPEWPAGHYGIDLT